MKINLTQKADNKTAKLKNIADVQIFLRIDFLRILSNSYMCTFIF